MSMTTLDPLNGQPDDALLVNMSLQDPDNFAVLVRRYEAKLLRYIKRSTSVSPEEAEDLLQEIFIKVYQHLNDFDPDLRFSSWIYRIAHNHIISAHRKKIARPQTINPDEDEFAKIASDVNIARDVEKMELNNLVRKVLDKLDPKYKEVLVLQFIEEKSYQEISDILKKPLGTIATLINRAKRRFADTWQEQTKQPPPTL